MVGRMWYQFHGAREEQIMMIESNTTLTLSTFPNKDTEFDSIWDCESGEKKEN